MDEIVKLRDAICDAYRTKEDLAEVLLSRLEFNYDTEVTSKGNYKQQVLDMIYNKFESNHGTKNLLEQLLTKRPNNEMLKACKKFWEIT
jgi:hypothetical protein